jgi:DNA invertase Pin-like site-specific DNA recombinase
MLIGYARVSTREQKIGLQLDALKEYGCERIFTDCASGAKSSRPGFDDLKSHLREGDIIVIWKLDRLGRSLRHLVDCIADFNERGIGLVSLNDPVDTTTPQGRLVFNIFASLAEFERELIRERTLAGLAAARARGRKGGRRPGMSDEAKHKARLAESLYKDGIPVSQICKDLRMSKSTLYVYLRHRGVEIGKAIAVSN